MSNGVLTVARDDGNDQRETMESQLQARLEAALEEAQSLELGEAPGAHDWNIWAFGPFNNPAPSRIIQVGQPALIITVVQMNAPMTAAVTGFGAEIQLNYFTSNMQTMTPAGGNLNFTYCIDTNLGQSTYVHYWWFTPTEAACLYETNICARLCNCDGIGVPGYGAFVRWVFDIDPEVFVPPPTFPAGVRFDHPIRFGVFDRNDPCCPKT